MGQKLRYGRPCTRDLPGTHNCFAQSHISSEFHYLMLAQFCKFGVSCCSIGFTYPAACTRARVPLNFGHVHSPPPPQFTQKGCQPTGLELRVTTMYLNFVGVAQKCFGGGAQKLGHPPYHPPPPPPSDSTHSYINRQILTRGFQIHNF